VLHDFWQAISVPPEVELPPLSMSHPGYTANTRLGAGWTPGAALAARTEQTRRVARLERVSMMLV
jgi:hypothetical protein